MFFSDLGYLNNLTLSLFYTIQIKTQQIVHKCPICLIKLDIQKSNKTILTTKNSGGNYCKYLFTIYKLC